MKNEQTIYNFLSFESKRFREVSAEDRKQIEEGIKKALGIKVEVIPQVTAGKIFTYSYLIREFIKDSTIDYDQVEVKYSEDIAGIINIFMQARLNEDYLTMYRGIRFNEQEIKYVIGKAKELINDLDRIDLIEDEAYKYYLDSIKDNYNDLLVVSMIRNYERVNSEVDTNEAFENCVYYCLGLWAWLEHESTIEEIRSLIRDTEPEEYYTIHEKMLKDRI